MIFIRIFSILDSRHVSQVRFSDFGCSHRLYNWIGASIGPGGESIDAAADLEPRAVGPKCVYDAGNAFSTLAEHRDADHWVSESLSPKFSIIRREKRNSFKK